jgi:hypothetical protein
MSDGTGVVDQPDGGFELGQDIINSAAAGLDAFIDTVSAFFQVYLFTSTTFLLTLCVLFILIYVVGQWPVRYGTKMQLRRTKRSIYGILLLTALFPILYVAGWIGTGSVSHAGFPQSGIFGTSFEERLVMTPDATAAVPVVPDGLGAFASIVATIFRIYLGTVVSVGLVMLVIAASLMVVNKAHSYGSQIWRERAYRYLVGVLVAPAVPPIAYLAGWIPSTSNTHSDLPEDTLFGFGFEDYIIGHGVEGDGLGMFQDLLIAFFRAYLLTMTSIFIILTALYLAGYFIQMVRSYGGQKYQERSHRTFAGLFLVSVILPILYVPVWVATGTQSPSGYNLPSDGVFGTTIEDRIFGPNIGEGGFGEFVSILANIVHTYQVTISFFLIVILIFLAIGYALVQWPNELQNRNFRGRLKRVGMGLLASVSFIPVLYAVGWVATGFYTPDESMTWVAPRVQLPYEELFTGPDYHPFIQDLSASSDPLAVVLRNLLDFQSLTILYVGIAAVVTGLLVYTVFDRTHYIDTDFGEQSFRGGVALIFIAFLVPFLITGAAWVATGVPDDGYLGDGPPGFSSECTDFEGGKGGWETTEGHTSPILEPAGIELDGTISQEFEGVGMGDRSVTIRPITDDKEFTIRMYEDGEKILEETTEHSASYIVGTDDNIRVEVSSNGGQISKLCVGFEPVSDPQLDIELEGVGEEKPLILRRGITMEYTVYNVGAVHTGSEFDVHLVLNGTDPWGETSSADGETTLSPMAGGEFSHEVTRFDELRGSPPTGRVQMIGYVDPYDELDERTTVPNMEDQYIDVVYANMYGYINTTTVNNNATDIQTRVVNNGTIYSDQTTANVTIYDGDSGGEVVKRWTLPVQNLTAGESTEDSLNYTFDSPGTYTTEINVSEFLFPRGSIDQETIHLTGHDLHANLTGVEEETRVDTPTEFTASVVNKGNGDFAGPTNATVELVDSTGTVTQEKEFTVPSLQEGEYHNETVQLTPDSGGTHTIRLDVEDSLYPAGSNDSEEILSLGPSFEGEVTAENIYQTEETDVGVTVTNNGNADSRSSQMHLTLQGPNGAVVENESYDVPALAAGETHTVQDPFATKLNESGQYDVDMAVEPTLSTTGATENASFGVYSFNISIDATPVSDSNEIEFDVGLENLANNETDSTADVVVTAENASGGVVAEKTITFSALNSGESQTRTAVLELESAGQYTGIAELQVGKNDTATVQFDHTWPDLRGEINATQTQVSGDQTVVQTNVTNIGFESSNASTAFVNLYDVENGESRVYRTSIDVPELDSGASNQQNVTVDIPDQGVYEAEINVVDEDIPENTVDRTEEITVLQSEVGIQIVERRQNVPSGENGTVDITVVNGGSVESGALPVTTEFTDPDGQTVATISEEVGPIPAGESVNITHSTKLTTIGTHDVESTVTSDISGTARDSTSIEVVEPYIIDVEMNKSRVPVGEPAEAEVSITNAGTQPREPNNLTLQYINPDGSVLEEHTASVAQLEPGEEQVFTFNTTLQNPGVHDVVGETQVEDSIIRDTAQVEAIDTYLINVDPVEPHVTTGDTGAVDVTIENVGNEQTSSNTVDTTFTAPDGSTAGSFDEEIPALDPGQQETFRVNTTLNEYGIYDITSTVSVEDFQAQDSAEIEVVEPFVVSVEPNQSSVDVGDQGEVTVTVRNIGDSTTDPNTVETTYYDPVEQEVASFTRDVPSLASGEEVSYTLSTSLDKAGVYEIQGKLSSSQYTVTDSGQIEAVEPRLTMRVNAEDDQIAASENGVLLADITNVGTDASEQRTVAVEFVYENGTAVDQWETTVGSLNPGESTTLRLSSDQLTEVGTYNGTVQTAKKDSGWLTGYDTIEVSPSSLSVDVSANNVEEGEPVDITTTVENTGVSTSDSTTATVRIEQNGVAVTEQTLDIRALDSGESQVNSPFNTTLEPGNYEVYFDVNTEESGTDDREGFQVAYWDLKGDIVASDERQDNQHEITVRVPNEGSVSSDPTTATINITGPSGTLVKQEQIDIPSISAGDTYTRDISLQAEEGGEYTANLDVVDEDRPSGTTDQETFVVTWGNLTSTISIPDTVEDDEGDFQVTVVNEGPGESYATTGTVNVRDSFGNIIQQYTVDISALQSGNAYSTNVTHQFERPGTYEGEVDVSYPEFPRGTTDTTGEVVVSHGNLNGRVYFSYGSSDIETEAPFTVQVTNAGNAVSESTTADVEIENRHGDIVYDTMINVPALEPGESTTRQMGATLNTSGTNTVRVDVNDPEFPIGNQGEDQIEVLSPDLRTSLDVEDSQIGEQTNVTMTIVNEGEITAESTTVTVTMYNDNDRQVVREEFGVQRLGPGESTEISYSQLIAAECWRTEMTCEPGATIDYGEYSATANADAEYAEEGSIGEDTFIVEQKQN